jgi:hypothetical protein
VNPKKRRRKHLNPVSSQEAYSRLVEEVRALTVPTKTRELGARAGIKPTDKGLMGALNILEVHGLIHMSSGPRNQRCWMPGQPSADPSAKRRAQLRPYRELERHLRWYSASRFATLRLLRLLGLPAAHQEPLLGALKALTSLDLVTVYRIGQKSVWWQWTGPRGLGNVYDPWPLAPSVEQAHDEQTRAQSDPFGDLF